MDTLDFFKIIFATLRSNAWGFSCVQNRKQWEDNATGKDKILRDIFSPVFILQSSCNTWQEDQAKAFFGSVKKFTMAQYLGFKHRLPGLEWWPDIFKSKSMGKQIDFLCLRFFIYKVLKYHLLSRCEESMRSCLPVKNQWDPAYRKLRIVFWPPTIMES